MSARRAAGTAAGLLALAALALASVWRIDRTERGVVVRFGRAVRVAPPGVCLTLPWPLERVVRVQATQVRTTEVGFAPEGRPALTGTPSESQWLTADTNIVELRLLVQYVVEDAAAYLFRVARSGGDDAVVRPVAESVLTVLVAGMKIDDVLAAGKSEIARRARAGIQSSLDELGLGVRLVGLNIADAAPPAQVIGAFNDVTSAASDAEREVDQADGYRRDLLPTQRAKANRAEQEARQEADRVVNEARARTQRFLALLAELRRAPEATRRRIWLEAVTELLSRGQRTVYPAGQGRFRYRIVE